MATLFNFYLFLTTLYADGGYQGPKFQTGLRDVARGINVEIVKRSDMTGFVVLPKRWSVERTIAWLTRCSRLAQGNRIWQTRSDFVMPGLDPGTHAVQPGQSGADETAHSYD